MKSPGARIQRTQEERDRLVEKYLPLVRYVVARLPVTMPAMLDRDDFYGVGVMGLMHAASTYDPTRGASFKTFAYTAIRGAILDEIRKHDPVPRNRRDRLRQIEQASKNLYAALARSRSSIRTSRHCTPRARCRSTTPAAPMAKKRPARWSRRSRTNPWSTQAKARPRENASNC